MLEVTEDYGIFARMKIEVALIETKFDFEFN